MNEEYDECPNCGNKDFKRIEDSPNLKYYKCECGWKYEYVSIGGN